MYIRQKMKGNRDVKKVILFDLYDTVLKDAFFSFKQGIQWLYENFFNKVCTWEVFESFVETFTPIYAKRKEDNSEVHLMQDEIVKIFEHFNVSLPKDTVELEYNLMNQMQQETLLEDVRETLSKLQKRNLGMYILSNSIFTGKVTERLLGEFDALKYFNKVFVSADYGIRKPHPGFFQMAVDVIQNDFPDVKKEDILYVGNDYVTDVQGAKTAGLDVVWYNVKQLPDEEEICIYNIEKFSEILNLIRN